MKNNITKCICIGIICILILSLVICGLELLQLHKILRYAESKQEPSYTLIVNGQIVEHPYAVQFDRYRLSADGLFEGYDDGRIEIPLLTVLGAMGAEYREHENGVVFIEYGDNECYLIPEKHALYPESIAPSEDSTQWDSENLLLVWPEKQNGYFREDQGEYIVDLGSLHQLALLWEFSFECDYERGIVFLYTNAAKANSLPGH